MHGQSPGVVSISCSILLPDSSYEEFRLRRALLPSSRPPWMSNVSICRHQHTKESGVIMQGSNEGCACAMLTAHHLLYGILQPNCPYQTDAQQWAAPCMYGWKPPAGTMTKSSCTAMYMPCLLVTWPCGVRHADREHTYIQS